MEEARDTMFESERQSYFFAFKEFEFLSLFLIKNKLIDLQWYQCSYKTKRSQFNLNLNSQVIMSPVQAQSCHSFLNQVLRKMRFKTESLQNYEFNPIKLQDTRKFFNETVMLTG